MRERGGVGVCAGGEEMGLMPVFEPGDLAAGEVAALGVIGDSNVAVR